MRAHSVHICGDCKQNRVEQNGAEPNETEQRRTQRRSASWLQQQGRSMFIGASSSLKSLCCLRDGVCYPPVPLASLFHTWRKRENLRGTGYEEEGKKEREPAVGRARKRLLSGHIGRDISSRESCGLAKSSQESDKPTTRRRIHRITHTEAAILTCL